MLQNDMAFKSVESRENRGNYMQNYINDTLFEREYRISVTFRPVTLLLTMITGHYNIIALEIPGIVKCDYATE